MTVTWRALGRAAAAAAALASFAACSHPKPEAVQVKQQRVFDELRAEIRTTVKDPARAEPLLRAIDDLEGPLAEASRERGGFERRLRALDASYATTAAQQRALFAEGDAARAAAEAKVVAITQRARALTTAGEWDHLAKYVVEALQPTIDRLTAG
jgi:hypothetical protein